jgi:hypothetical protein
METCLEKEKVIPEKIKLGLGEMEATVEMITATEG